MQKESFYEQYLKRVEGLPDFIPLTKDEWESQANPKQPEASPEPEPKQRPFTATEQAHMLVLEEERKQRERTRLKPDNPLDAGFPKQGLSAEEQALKERESNESAFRALQAQAEEDRRASEERERKLQKEVIEQEHLSEIAKTAYASDQIRAGRKI